MQPNEDFLLPFPDSYVIGVDVVYHISLTPRFSAVYGRSATTTVVNTQLKQGVNEKSVDTKPYSNSFSP